MPFFFLQLLSVLPPSFFLYLLHAYFSNCFLFLHLFLFSTSSYFFLYFFFQYLWIFFFGVGLSSTFYGFLCFSIYGFYLGWYGILMVISSFWSDLWVWSSDLRCGCGVRIFEMWLWVWVWGSDFVLWLWWFEYEMWLWVWGLDLWCGYGEFRSEMWWPFLSLPLCVWVYVCMFKIVLICFRFDFQICWLLGREIKEGDDNCREKNEWGMERKNFTGVDFCGIVTVLTCRLHNFWVKVVKTIPNIWAKHVIEWVKKN